MNATNVAARMALPLVLGLGALAWGCVGLVEGAGAADDDPGADALLADAPLEDVVPPEVELVSPEPGAVFTESQTVVLEAEASDESGVDRVVFFDGDIRLGAADGEPYRYEWSVTEADNGEHDLVAKAFDAAGNSATSAVVSVAVDIRESQTGEKRKWFPGQYSKTEGASGPGFTGWRVNVNWRQCEPHDGQYDFSMIEGSLDRAQAQGKKVIIHFAILGYFGPAGTAPDWAKNQGAVYSGHFADGRQFGVLKVWEPWVSTKLIALWEAMRQRFENHPALAMFVMCEALMVPQPDPGYTTGHTPEKMRTEWFRWCDHFNTWIHTPCVFTMTWGSAQYKEQMSQYAINKRIGVRGPDLKTPNRDCALVPNVTTWRHAWTDYQGQAVYQIMVSQPSTRCYSTPQQAYNDAVALGIHFLDWVDYPINWTSAQQKAFVQSKANLPACGMNAERPSMWPEHID